MGINAVVFDYGQVISLPQDPKVPGLLAEKAGVPRAQFEPLIWSLRDDYDRGTITAREYYRLILSRLGVHKDDKGIDELIEMDHRSWQNINPGTVKLMEDVKKAGYTLGILSNMPHDFLAWARENIPVFSLPHTSVFSCEFNLIKPEKAIYAKLLSLLGLPGNEVAFFDDREDNIESARALGIEAFLWDSPENARRTLLSLGVRL